MGEVDEILIIAFRPVVMVGQRNVAPLGALEGAWWIKCNSEACYVSKIVSFSFYFV